MAKGTTNTSPMALIIVITGIYLWPLLVGLGLLFLAEKIRTEFILIAGLFTLTLAFSSLFLNMSLYTSIGVVVTIGSIIGYFLYLYNTNIDRITEEVQSK